MCSASCARNWSTLYGWGRSSRVRRSEAINGRRGLIRSNLPVQDAASSSFAPKFFLLGPLGIVSGVASAVGWVDNSICRDQTFPKKNAYGAYTAAAALLLLEDVVLC